MPKKLLIRDMGGFTTLLPTLREKFDVSYFCVHEQSFPRSNVAQEGKGIEGVQYVERFWDAVDDADLIFPRLSRR